MMALYFPPVNSSIKREASVTSDLPATFNIFINQPQHKYIMKKDKGRKRKKNASNIHLESFHFGQELGDCGPALTRTATLRS